MSYAAYLRVYEPVSAFHEPDRSRWIAYAASDARPRRRDALAAEHAEALRRIVASPSEPIPDEESGHAYVRSVDGVVYVCPWQTRLRSLLACAGLASVGGEGWERHPAGAARGAAVRQHIRTSSWTVPLAWFVPFVGAERWVAFGARVPRTQQGVDLRSTAQMARTLVYVTTMTRARRRVARGLAALRCQGSASHGAPGVGGETGQRGQEDQRGQDDLHGQEGLRGQSEIDAELAVIARWIEGFHPCSLVELDYGGLVYLLNDDALWRDESAAEMAAAIDGTSRGHRELAAAMYGRVQARWRVFKEFEQVN